MTGWTTDDVPDLTGRRALVTGATSGIGEALVEALAGHGAHVVMAARSREKLAASMARIKDVLPRVRLEPLRIDLANQASVRHAAAEAAGGGPLHILVNNAGVMATPFERTTDGFELQMATNVWGHFTLTGLLFPQLVAAGEQGGKGGHARVVSVSSLAHRFAREAPLQDPRHDQRPYRPWPTYARTKLGNLLFTHELDRRAARAGLPVRALTAHPGLSATGLMRGADRGPGGRILDGAFGLLGQDPAVGALPLLMAATADLPGAAFVGPRGPGELRGTPELVGTAKRARDIEAGKQLWHLAEEATGVRYP